MEIILNHELTKGCFPLAFCSNPTWKYISMILYAVLGILLLAALILPSIFVYLLAPEPVEPGMLPLNTYRNHCGRISPKASWQIYSTTIMMMRVNTSECDFQETPLYFVSVGGSSYHYCLTGYGAIYLPTTASFQIYVRDTCRVQNASALISEAKLNGWDVNWIGFYK